MTGAEPPIPRPVLERPDGFSLAANFVPLVLLAAGLALATLAGDRLAARAGAFALWLYLAPPLAARGLTAVCGRPGGELRQGDPGYRVWWLLTQLQMPFNRLPALEEALRLVPGLYAAWIGLWGGRVSARAFIGPRVVIADRWLVEVEAGAVVGFGAGLSGHMVTRDDDGRFRVTVAAPRVGAEAIVGGGAGLGPGAELAAGALLPAGRRIGPFDRFPRTVIAGTASEEAGP